MAALGSQWRLTITGFPLRLEKWEGIFQSGKSQEILKTGKVRENHIKYWKTQGI